MITIIKLFYGFDDFDVDVVVVPTAKLKPGIGIASN